MMTLEEVRRQLQDRNLRAVQRATGLSYSTIYEIKNNKIFNPNYDTYKKLVDYLRGTM